MTIIRKYQTIIILILVCYGAPVAAQVDWMETMGVANNDYQQYDSYIRDLKTDHKNNVYVLGSTMDDADNILFYENKSKMKLQFENFNPPLFLAKFNSKGILLWTKELVCYGDGKIAIDKSDNVYVSAGFYLSASIDGDSVKAPASGVFLAKIDENGKLLWVKTGSSPTNPSVVSMFCSEDDKLYISGNYSSNSMQWDTTRLRSNVSPAIYMMKIDPNGNVEWANNVEFIKYGWTVMGSAVKMKIGKDGNLYGVFAEGGRNWFSSCEYNKWHMLLCCFTISGQQIWSKDFVCSDLLEVSDMDVNSFGEILVIGSFRGTFNFDKVNISSGIDPKNFCHSMEAFLAKFDRYGNALFAENVPDRGFSSDYYQIFVNSDDSYAITGMRNYNSATGYPGYNRDFPIGKNRFFVSKYDFMGNPAGEIEFYKTTSNTWPDAYFETNPHVQIDENGNYIVADNVLGQYDTFPGCITYQNQNTILFNQNIILYKLNKDKINSPSQDHDSKVYLSPNPAQNVIYVEIKDSSYLQYTSYITDMTGRLVLQNQKSDVEKNVYQIDISSLAAGMYLLNAVNQKGMKTLKFVKYSR